MEEENPKVVQFTDEYDCYFVEGGKVYGIFKKELEEIKQKSAL